MQLMPRTASYIGRQTTLHGRGKHKLFDPGLNMALGQRYIAYLLEDEAIGNDLFRLAAAYNAGPGNLRSWQRSVDYRDDPLLFIESLPSRETRLFIERILTNFWIYRDRLGQPAPSLENVVTGTWPGYVPLDGTAQEQTAYAGN
jgi:soluble lytic murein transglycosylase-like protein